jgi:hypothetical protein
VSQRPALGCLFEVIETLVLTIVIFLGIQTFIAQPYKVQQTSMEHTLEPDQYVLVDKLSPPWAPFTRATSSSSSPRRGSSGGGGRSSSGSSASRVAGVVLRDGKVFVNDAIQRTSRTSSNGVPDS